MSTTSVVVVGAGCAGLAVARGLGGVKDVTVTVIEPKAFYEFTPGILHALVNPKHYASISTPLNRCLPANATHVQALATDIDFERRSVSVSTDHPAIPYDYLVLAFGTSYPGTIKAQATSLEGRTKEVAATAAEFADASSILLSGCGEVAVELAAELAYAYRSTKAITLVSSHDRLLPKLPVSVGAAAHGWLVKRGVTVVLGNRATASPTSTTQFRLQSPCPAFPSQTIQADVHVPCFGSRPHDGFAGPGFLRTAAGSTGRIEVDGTLRPFPAKFPTVFAVGDGIAHCSTTAVSGLSSVAETQGDVVAKSIGNPTLAPARYPASLTKAPDAPELEAISLGPYEAMVVFNWFTLSGWPGRYLGGVVKSVIERTKMVEIQVASTGSKASQAFWHVAHYATFVMNRFLITPSHPSAPEPTTTPTAEPTAAPMAITH